jgi:hypothetical protein
MTTMSTAVRGEEREATPGRQRRALIAGGVVVALVGAVLVVVSRAPSNVGTAKEIKHAVEVRSGGGASFKPVREHPAVKAGDVVRTSDSGVGQIDYGDGSVTRLDSNTVFTVDELLATGKRVVRASLSEGRVWSKVNKLSGSDDRFEIRTPNATASVRGTSFGCESEPLGNDLFLTTCYQGTGQTDLVWDDGSVDHLGPGQCKTNSGPCRYTQAQLIAILAKFAPDAEHPWTASPQQATEAASEVPPPGQVVAGIAKELQANKEPKPQQPSAENHDDKENSNTNDDDEPSLEPHESNNDSGGEDPGGVEDPGGGEDPGSLDDGNNGHGNDEDSFDESNPGGG